MSKKRLEKKTPDLDPDFKEVLVCNDNKIKPFIEIFIQKPENIAQENLGTLFGILEITDNSEDSSYIVNYLISVIKKEYYSKTKRGAIESFEAALHKTNLALAKLAEHGSINWIGKLNALICVTEKSSFHFSQTGTAQAFLLRSKSMTNISEGGEDVDPNPLKTFQDVLSGRLEENDKLILTTDAIFEIFSFEEIKRSALKFSQDEFIQFLKTALINELDRAAVLVIDVKEKEEKKEEEYFPQPERKIENAFSQKAFERPALPPKQPSEIPKNEEDREKIIKELKDQLEKNQEEFVDKKTGHIYIKDDGLQLTQEPDYLSVSRDKAISIGTKFKDFAKKLDLKKIHFSGFNLRLLFKKNLKQEILGNQKVEASDEQKFFSSFGEKSKRAFSQIFLITKNLGYIIKDFFFDYIVRPSKNFLIWILLKYQEIREKKQKYPNPSPTSSMAASKVYQPGQPSYVQKAAQALPSFSKIKNILSALDYHKKLYAILAVVAIFVIPYIYVKTSDRMTEKKTAAVEAPQETIVPLGQDKNVVRTANAEEILQNPDILQAISINGQNFALAKNEIISLSDNKSYPLPDSFRDFQAAFQMEDLNLIFLEKDNKIISFHANSRKFQDNNISIPNDSNTSSFGSFLTYAYLLDNKNSQIYRYPRAEGGFGEKTNWLKDSVDLSSAKSMAINENIYVATDANIFKFSKGKKQDFNISETATPIEIFQIYTLPESQNLYVLDKKNSRVIKLDASGNIQNQYYNQDIWRANSFAVDEENNTILFSDEFGIKSLKME